jgi:hypothetical protein
LDFERDFLSRDVAHAAEQFAAGAVQDNHVLARLEAQDISGMVRLGASQNDRIGEAVLGREVESVHKGRWESGDLKLKIENLRFGIGDGR